jgi:hypothetical protein
VKAGDLVKCLSVDKGLHTVLTEGKTYTVTKGAQTRGVDGDLSTVHVIADNGNEYGFSPKRFELVKEST